MAAEAVGEERPALFLRKATGLVRGWSVRDSMIYACLATNVVTLGIYEFSFNSFIPKGQLLTSVLVSAVWVSFLVIAYTGLIVTIPRAGGDYVWQTRILGSGLGFVMAATGWWFILWLWAPIYGNILSVQLFEPLWATLQWTWPAGGAAWFGTNNGIFVVTLITIGLAGVLVSIGMAGYAKIQRWCFICVMIGFLVVVMLLLFISHASFVSSFNLEAHKLFGVNNAYAATNAAAAKAGYSTSALGFGPLGPTMLLVPAMMFFILWPNWGATLYGEIRGASDFRRVFTGMFAGLWITVACTVVFLLLTAKTLGWAFYQNANATFYNAKSPIPVWPYPFMFAGWLVHNTAFQVALILVLGVPIVPVSGVITIGLLGFNLYEWFSNDLYFVNNRDSLYYMAAMYVLAIVLYIAARLIRRRQGIDLGLINKEIPVE